MKNKFTDIGFNHPYRPLKKIKVAWGGFWFVMKNDLSVAYKVILSIFVLIFSYFLRQSIDIILVVLATGLMICMEMMNSCVELMCDFFETGYNEKIKIIKDVSAAAAGISILVWVIVIGYEIIELVVEYL